MSAILAIGYDMDNSISDLNGINTYTNPFNTADGNIIHCVNLASNTNGSRIKRPGYDTFLGNPDNAKVNSLFSWLKNDGSTLYVYRASGSALYYSAQGTGAWTVCGNGTIADGAHVTTAILDDNMIMGDGVGTTRYTTDGTSFTDIPLAPIGGHDPVEYQGRIYIQGTASHVFYSVVGTINDFDPTHDSSSLFIGGSGKLLTQYKASDRLIFCKSSGKQFRWDGDTLVDTATRLGPSSAFCVGEIEDYRFWANRIGVFISNADKPQLISNPVHRQFADLNTHFDSTDVFNNLVAGVHGYDFMIAIDAVTDDFTDIPLTSALLVYDYHHNEFINYVLPNFPTALHSFVDNGGTPSLIFGDEDGQVFRMNDALRIDQIYPIEASMVMILHGNLPHVRKDFGNIEFFASPGCQAKVQYAVEDVVQSGENKISGPRIWKDLCSLSKGYTLSRFPPETRGRLLYLKFYENSLKAPWEIFSIHYTWENVPL